MRYWLRGKKGGLLAFLAIVALVAGALGWVTAASLRMEREQLATAAQARRSALLRARQREQEDQENRAQAELAARLRLALWRLDSRISPVLAREDTRPYNHYSAVFAPSVALDIAGYRCQPATILEPSPLLNTDLPDWMLLHFQANTEQGWGSPQVLSSTYLQHLQRGKLSLGNVTPGRRELLAGLSDSQVAKTLLSQLRQQELQLTEILNSETAPETVAQEQQVNPSFQQQANPSGQQPGSQPPVQGASSRFNQKKPPNQEYQNRAMSRAQAELESKQSPQNDLAGLVHANIAQNGSTWFAPDVKNGPADQVIVSVTPMIPLWLVTRGEQEKLVVARLVRASSVWPEFLTLFGSGTRPLNFSFAVAYEGGNHKLPPAKEVCQGIVLDWPRLQALLIDEVRDLFPGARFLPMRDKEPVHPERTMTALPVEMEPDSAGLLVRAPLESLSDHDLGTMPAGPGWTPLRVGLALAWAAALVALGAVGLGGWSLLDLSERRIRFVSTVTHELRTPLTTLRLYLDMLTGGIIKEEKQKAEYLHTLNAETDRLNRLVGNVLDFSRLENQRPRLEKTHVVLGSFLEQVHTTWQGRCQDAEKELIVENAAGADLQFFTDVQLLQQIVGNLIDNACKYSREAEDVRIWLRARKEGNRLTLEVEDRGPGVAARERRSIFRPFRRGQGVDVTGGVGLGLALADRWAQFLGGKLTLRSGKDPAGACFRFILPVS